MKTFDVQIEGTDIICQCKKLSFREFRKAVQVVEAIQGSGISSKTLELIYEGVQLCVDGWNQPEPIEDIDSKLDMHQMMDLIGAAVRGGRVNDDERKKSE